MWLSFFCAKRRGIGLPVFSEYVLALHTSRQWAHHSYFSARLGRCSAFSESSVGVRCLLRIKLVPAVWLLPLAIHPWVYIAFHPRGFYLPGYLILFTFPSTFLDVSSARELWQPWVTHFLRQPHRFHCCIPSIISAISCLHLLYAVRLTLLVPAIIFHFSAPGSRLTRNSDRPCCWSCFFSWRATSPSDGQPHPTAAARQEATARLAALVWTVSVSAHVTWGLWKKNLIFYVPGTKL